MKRNKRIEAAEYDDAPVGDEPSPQQTNGVTPLQAFEQIVRGCYAHYNHWRLIERTGKGDYFLPKRKLQWDGDDSRPSLWRELIHFSFQHQLNIGRLIQSVYQEDTAQLVIPPTAIMTRRAVDLHDARTEDARKQLVIELNSCTQKVRSDIWWMQELQKLDNDEATRRALKDCRYALVRYAGLITLPNQPVAIGDDFEAFAQFALRHYDYEAVWDMVPQELKDLLTEAVDELSGA